MTQQIKICSNALLLLGHNSISSFSQPGAGAKLSEALYPTTYADFLTVTSWNFNRKFANLNRLAEESDIPQYQYKYKLPHDYIRISTTIPMNDYMIVQDELHSNFPELQIEYFYLVDEAYLPPYAIKAMEFLMAAALAVPLTADTQKAQLYMSMATAQIQSAMQIDSQSAPQKGFMSTPVLDVRFR